MSKRPLQELRALLLNQAEWPKGFRWRYSGLCGCVVGLSHSALGTTIDYGDFNFGLGDAFELDRAEASKIVFNAGDFANISSWDVKPEHVVAVIDHILQAREEAA